MPDVEAAPSAATEAPETQTPAPESIDFGENAAPEPEVEASATSDQSESQDESVSAPEAAKPPEEATPKAERRIRQLTAQVRQLQRQLQTPQQQQQAQRMMQQPVRPKLDQFETIEAYDQALEKYDTDSRQYAVQEAMRAEQQRAAAESQAKQMAELRDSWQKRSERIQKANPDFNVVEALGRVEPNPTMDAFFLDSEVGPELLDYLDTHPDESDRIRDMTPFKAVRELVKIEDRLTLQVKGIKPKPTLTPVTPLQGARGRTSAPAAPKTAADVLYG